MKPDGFRAALRGRKGAVLCVALVIWGLTLFDLTLIPRAGNQFLQALGANRLVGARVSSKATVVTSADPTSPIGPWVLTETGNTVGVLGTQLPTSQLGLARAHHIFHPRETTTVDLPNGVKPVDVDRWDGDNLALFAISAPRRQPTLYVYSLHNPKHPAMISRVPLHAQTTDRRNFFVATWSGRRPDLFVIDRNANRRRPLTAPSTRRWSIDVYSGESKFRDRIEHFLATRKTSRILSKYEWWLDIGSRRKHKPSLILVTRSRLTGSGRTEIHVLSGKSRFRAFSLHAATELPQRLGLDRQFAFESGPGGGSVLMFKIQRGKLSVRLLPLP